VITQASLEREVWLQADSSQLGAARSFADDAAGQFGLGEEERYEFTFAVNEAVSNAIEHGAPSAEGKIRLYTAIEDGALALYVWDWGCFSAQATVPQALPERGRGLAFMAAMVDEVDLRREGEATVVRVAKRATA
jgi:anti-sigma regulatory factor (Ser/Thr protein kinase)